VCGFKLKKERGKERGRVLLFALSSAGGRLELGRLGLSDRKQNKTKDRERGKGERNKK